MSILSLHLLSDVPHVVDSALSSRSACRGGCLHLSCAVTRLIAPTNACHQLRQNILPLLLPFVLLLPFHAGVIQPFSLCWPCHSWTYHSPLPIFAFALTVSPAVPTALACIPSFAAYLPAFFSESSMPHHLFSCCLVCHSGTLCSGDHFRHNSSILPSFLCLCLS